MNVQRSAKLSLRRSALGLSATALVALGAGLLSTASAEAGERNSLKSRSGSSRDAARNFSQEQYEWLKQRPGVVDTGGGLINNGGVAGESLTCTTIANCQARNNDDADVSNRSTFVVADGFTPAVTGDVNEICWWGAYDDTVGDCQGAAPDTFDVKYYENNGGVPGALLANYSQESGTLTVTGPTATGDFVAGFAPEYAYTATHANLPVTAGGCYWVEISNSVDSPGCVWFWERGFDGDSRGMQDGPAPDGYGIEDGITDDHAFCLNLPLDASQACYPAAPSNDDCANSITVQEGITYFDTTSATTDGLAEEGCLFVFEEHQVNQDIWFDFTAPCDGEVRVALCTSFYDTKMTIYNGLDCPIEPGPLDCSDDDCGTSLLQSSILLLATAGDEFKIRIGGYSTDTTPGFDVGPGSVNIQCGTPCGPGAGDCFEPNGTPGCEDEACCDTVCEEDSFCCDTEWDDFCANTAVAFCLGNGAVCAQATGDCCAAQEGPGCSDIACCVSVCECDTFCCQVEWDSNCALNGVGDSGCGAATLCEDLCTACPDGEVTWFDPTDGTIDAGQPNLVDNNQLLQGIGLLTVVGPEAADDATCWDLCETDQNSLLYPPGSGANFILDVSAQGGGLYTLTLAHPLTPGEVSHVSYTSSSGATVSAAALTAHPGDVNGDGVSDGGDVLSMVFALDGIQSFPLLQTDMNRDEATTPEDMLRLVDLLNGGGEFSAWFGAGVAQTPCP